MAHAADECRAEVAADIVLRPERRKPVAVLAVHVRPFWTALEAVHDLPCPAVDRPVVERFVEEAVDHRFAMDEDVQRVAFWGLSEEHASSAMRIDEVRAEVFTARRHYR